jgi:hypothetical protein
MTFSYRALQCRIQRSFGLVALFTSSASMAQAQQSCTPATSAARHMVTGFLLDPSELYWRRALNITATSGDSLRVLTDPTDAAICQRIRSAVDARPLYMFWAGSAVIVTSTPGLQPDPVTGAVTNEEGGKGVWVFDSSGEEIHAQGDDRIVTPQSLQATSSTFGRVVLQWTNPTNPTGDILNYELQRALGGGAFAPLAFPLSSTTTTFTDTSALSKTSYRYRLFARTARDSNYSNVAGVTVCCDIGSVTRTTTGLLRPVQSTPRPGPYCTPARCTSSMARAASAYRAAGKSAIPSSRRSRQTSAHTPASRPRSPR